MRRPKGPELKMPDLKVPAALADLFYDLRDRRLLPLIGLVLVAIVAAPFLLGDQKAIEPPPSGGVAEALDSAEEPTSRLTVVEAKPGLRDYRKRLRDRSPTDPFEQRYVTASLDGAELNDPEGGESGSTSKSTTDGSSGDGGGSPQPAPGFVPPGGAGSPKIVFFAWAINVRIVKEVDGDRQDPIVRKRVLPQTPLPGKKTPVVTFMGPALSGKKANGKVLLLVSDKVRSVAGDARCVSGDEICQLLEVEPGFPVVLTYGENEAKYTVNVLKLDLVVTGRG